MERYKLNVGGSIFEIPKECLMRYPDTLLGTLSKDSAAYDPITESFFFNRNPEIFNNVLDLYRTDSLHLPSGTCSGVIRRELAFWKIPLDKLCQCCQQSYFRYERELAFINILKKTFDENDLNYDNEEIQRSRFKFVLSRIWLFFDQPKSSIYARVR